ncbi:MAG: hypothetical protein EOR51_19925 [Mesorhizobium sp.]|nr:MAG: hypothetical protein EOR51_19925 [Mesorhizobium sp.]
MAVSMHALAVGLAARRPSCQATCRVKGQARDNMPIADYVPPYLMPPGSLIGHVLRGRGRDAVEAYPIAGFQKELSDYRWPNSASSSEFNLFSLAEKSGVHGAFSSLYSGAGFLSEWVRNITIDTAFFAPQQVSLI